MTRPARYIDPLEGLLARIAATAAPMQVPESPRAWPSWRERTLDQLRAALGPFPEPVPLNVETLERHDEDGYTRERVLYDSEEFATVPAWLLVPDDLRPGERRPAILCAHGHGPGKDTVAGVPTAADAATPAVQDEVAKGRHDYGRELARRGYVCLIPDWRGFGERRAPDGWLRSYNDACDLLYLGYGYLGYQLLTLNLCDAVRGLDVLQALPFVDPARLGVVGLSFGGTMATFLAAIDERVRCAVISCYISTIREALSHRGRANTCGSQFVPGLLNFGDIASVAGLIAPRPCLVEIGAHDDTFALPDARSAHSDLERIYLAAGAKDRLDVDIFPGGHEFSGRKSFDWFAEWL